MSSRSLRHGPIAVDDLASLCDLGGEPQVLHVYSSGPQEFADDLGLLAEEVHPAAGELLGRFPQTFSHTGLANAAWKISKSGAPSPLVIMLFSQARPRGS
jgi:hypothetical protein